MRSQIILGMRGTRKIRRGKVLKLKFIVIFYFLRKILNFIKFDKTQILGIKKKYKFTFLVLRTENINLSYLHRNHFYAFHFPKSLHKSKANVLLLTITCIQHIAHFYFVAIILLTGKTTSASW
jgi:hypothetical protein